MDQTNFVNLKIISKLRPNTRLDTRNELFRIYIPYIIPTWLTRWWYGNTRACDITRVTVLYDNIMKHPPNENMIKQLHESIHGLNQLKLTYSDDPTTVARIEYLVESIQQFTSTNNVEKYNA